jgi:hypothetical protein
VEVVFQLVEEPIQEGSTRSDDGRTWVEVSGRAADAFPHGSVFADLGEASSFVERGSLGYSGTDVPGRYEALELRTENWHVAPLEVERVESSFFHDAEVFPPGAVEFDDALLMRDVDHEWHARQPLYCSGIAETEPRRPI